MDRPSRIACIGSLAVACSCLWLGSCADSGRATSPQAPDRTAAAPLPVPQEHRQVLDGLAAAIISASPIQTGATADDAANRLAHLGALIDAAAEPVLWYQARERDGGQPTGDPGIALVPEIWAGVYLSRFEFFPPHAIRRERDQTILSIPARLRNGLEPGDYPYPIWHSADTWNVWHATRAIELVFDGRAIVATRLRTAGDAPPPPPAPAWDGRWTWRDDHGAQQPRIAQVSYNLAAENPHARTLSRAFNELHAVFEQHGCIDCHSPANPAAARRLFLLALPNQALASREALIAALDPQAPPMPEGVKCTVGTLRDRPDANAIRSAAARLADETYGALAYETIYFQRPEEAPFAP